LMDYIYETEGFESKIDWILLIDVDSVKKLINNVIGKYITHYESKNYGVRVLKLKYSAYPHKRKKTIIDASHYSAVRVSIIFKRNKDMVEVTNCDDVLFGGPGYDPLIKLPDEIDDLDASYYGDTNERIEFYSRGCIRDCHFCGVREKEGYLYEYRDINRILSNYDGENIRFFDNNFLANEKANEIMEILITKNISCSFNEGLDIRLINDVNADLLSRLNHYPTEYIFAFDDISSMSVIEKKTVILKKYIKKDWKLKYYIFTDADEPILEVLKRIHWCKENAVLPYIMRYDNCYTSDQKDFYTDLSAWCNQPNIFKKLSFEQYIDKRVIKKARKERSFTTYKNSMASTIKNVDLQNNTEIIEKEPVKKLAIEIGNMRFTLYGEVEIRTIITRTVGRGKDPDKLVTHKQKWKKVTKTVSDHPRGKTRSIANKIFAMIRKDYDDFNLPEPLLPPVIIESDPEPESEPVQDIPEDSKIEVQKGIPSTDPGIQRPAKIGVPSAQNHGVQRSIDQGIPSMAMEELPEPKINNEPKVNELNNLLTRVRKVRSELDVSWRNKIDF